MYLLPDAAAHGAHPADIFRVLVARYPEFAHLRDGEPAVTWLFKTAPTFRQGRQVLGTVFLPSVQGQLKPLFEWMLEREFGLLPDFLVVLDFDFWMESDALAREILVFHESMHMGQALDKDGAPRFDKETGKPIFSLNGHDVEEFAATVRRYGAYSADIRAFLAAAGEHRP